MEGRDELQKQVEGLTEEHAEGLRQIEELKRRLKDSTVERCRLVEENRAKVEYLEGELDRARGTNEHLMKKKADLGLEVEALRTDKRLRAELAGAGDLGEVELEVLTLRTSIDVLRTREDDSTKEKIRLGKRNDELRRELDAAKPWGMVLLKELREYLADKWGRSSKGSTVKVAIELLEEYRVAAGINEGSGARDQGEGGLVEQLDQAMDLAKPGSTVDHPDHYNKGDMEAIAAIEGLGFGEGFNLGNVIKYIARVGHKGTEREDFDKALWYLKREIERRARLRVLKGVESPSGELYKCRRCGQVSKTGPGRVKCLHCDGE